MDARAMPTPSVPGAWADRLLRLDHAFQPIVNVHTGLCYGYEALLRRFEDAGFASIQTVFDTAHDQGILPAVGSILWSPAVPEISLLPPHPNPNPFFKPHHPRPPHPPA